MAPRKTTSTSAAMAPSKWAPPATAAEGKLELAEFVKWEKIGDVLLGRIEAGSFRQRPDPLKPDKMMASCTFSPAGFIPAGAMSEGNGYESLALGISAHIDLLIPGIAQGLQDGKCYAIVYEADRDATVRGQRPSRNFGVYPLTEAELKTEIARIADISQLPF